MHELAGVLFKVQMVKMHPLRFAVHDDVKVSALGDGVLVLRYLIGLRQVRVKVVFPVEARVILNVAVKPQPHFYGEVHGVVVDDRQSARHREADGTDVGVRRRADIVRRTAAEKFRLRL